MFLIVLFDKPTLHGNYIMPFFNLISFYENAKFSFYKRGSNFLVCTVFTSMASFMTLYIY